MRGGGGGGGGARVVEGGRSHLKVAEDAFNVSQYPLPVGPVGFEHLLHRLPHCGHKNMSQINPQCSNVRAYK